MTRRESNKVIAVPPVEISFSGAGKDDDGMVSLGSAMCGVSVTQQSRVVAPNQEPTADTDVPITISHTTKDNSKSKPSGSSKEGASNTASKKGKKNKSTTAKATNGTSTKDSTSPTRTATKKVKKKKGKK